jgi:hypothetical protein
MKPTHSPNRTAVVALFAALPALAHAHPGHSALDWFSNAPHAGHENEYATLLSILALIVLALAGYWLAWRKR